MIDTEGRGELNRQMSEHLNQRPRDGLRAERIQYIEIRIIKSASTVVCNLGTWPKHHNDVQSCHKSRMWPITEVAGQTKLESEIASFKLQSIYGCSEPKSKQTGNSSEDSKSQAFWYIRKCKPGCCKN